MGIESFYTRPLHHGDIMPLTVFHPRFVLLEVRVDILESTILAEAASHHIDDVGSLTTLGIGTGTQRCSPKVNMIRNL